MGKNDQIFHLSITDTQILKGIAILLLLCHHCLYRGEGYNDTYIHCYPIFKSLGVFCKLCVSAFVFLSGYGLSKVAIINNGIGNPLQFYRKRYVKLMMNYWFIWLLFVPMGVLLFNRTFPEVYGPHFILKGVVDFLGMYQAVYASPYGYNDTWWFYSCIIVLYFFFPFLWKTRDYWLLILPIILLLPAFGKVPVLGSSNAFAYFPPFYFGFLCSFIKIPMGKMMTNFPVKLMMGVGFVIICLYRFIFTNGPILDTCIIVLGVYLYKILPSSCLLSKVFSFLGQHSFNIFLFHTFIYLYYFHNFIFWSRNPIIICISLLITCIIISIMIEKLKVLLRIYILQEKLIG